MLVILLFPSPLMRVMVLGNVILVRGVFSKAFSPISRIPLFIVTSVSPELANTELLNEVMVPGIVILVSCVHPLKA